MRLRLYHLFGLFMASHLVYASAVRSLPFAPSLVAGEGDVFSFTVAGADIPSGDTITLGSKDDTTTCWSAPGVSVPFSEPYKDGTTYTLNLSRATTWFKDMGANQSAPWGDNFPSTGDHSFCITFVAANSSCTLSTTQLSAASNAFDGMGESCAGTVTVRNGGTDVCCTGECVTAAGGCA